MPPSHQRTLLQYLDKTYSRVCIDNMELIPRQEHENSGERTVTVSYEAGGTLEKTRSDIKLLIFYWFPPTGLQSTWYCITLAFDSVRVLYVRGRQNCPPHSSSLGRKSTPAFAKAWFWQFRSQMATELIT